MPRTFPPLYVSSGDTAMDRLAFFHILERLKTQKRTGWVDHDVPEPESISDHMYRMAVMAMCTSDQSLDIAKCVMMAVVHDIAEAQVGDIAPREGIPKVEKRRLEAEAMQNFVHEMLHDSPAARRILSLWEEYEAGQSSEARFVKDLDRFEMASQGQSASPLASPFSHPNHSYHHPCHRRLPHLHLVTRTPPRNPHAPLPFPAPAFEYEKNHGMKNLQPFFDSSLPNIKHPEVAQWGQDLLDERERELQLEASAGSSGSP